MNRLEIGKIGEVVAKKYLEKSGFVVKNSGDENNACPYDILCEKDNILYAINVKTASNVKGAFTLRLSNIPRLLEFCKTNKAIPVYLLAHKDRFVFFGLYEDFSDWATQVEQIQIEEHSWRAKIISRNRVTIPDIVAKQWELKKGDVVHVSMKRSRKPTRDMVI